MITPFELFKEEAHGMVQGLEGVSNLKTGKEKARERMARSPGKYFIYRRRTGNKLYVEPDDKKYAKQ